MNVFKNPEQSDPKKVYGVMMLLIMLGIALGYFTNYAEPWGSIGGFVTGGALAAALFYTLKRRNNSDQAPPK